MLLIKMYDFGNGSAQKEVYLVVLENNKIMQYCTLKTKEGIINVTQNQLVK